MDINATGQFVSTRGLRQPLSTSSSSAPNAVTSELIDRGQVAAAQAWQIGEAASTLTCRWRKEDCPILVMLADESLFEPVQSALAQWELAAQNELSFVVQVESVKREEAQLSDEPIEPDFVGIRIGWIEEATLGREFEVGHANRSLRNDNSIASVAVELLRQPKIDARLSPEKKQLRLQATLLHELGHALGLEHSNGTQDVMHHRGWKNTLLSQNDVTAVQTLYHSKKCHLEA